MEHDGSARWGQVPRPGLFGGSFDPVHAGHLHVVRAAQRAFRLERVLFVPAARPPHKPERDLAPAEDRLAMLRIATASEPSWEVSSLELERDGPSYTIDTVRALPTHLGLRADARIHLLIGSDNLHGFERWREVRTLLGLVQPVVVARSVEDDAALERIRAALGAELFAAIERGLLRLPPVEVSSTALRATLETGEDPGDALPAGVLEYIRARGIYSGRTAP